MAKRWSIALVCLVLGGLSGTLLTERLLQGQAPVSAAIPKELTSYRDIVKTVLPAVVSIEAKAKVQPRRASQQNPQRGRPRGPGVPGLPEEFRKFFEDMEQSPEGSQVPRIGFGSGLIVDPKGVILTNYHVVEGAASVEVELKDGRKFTSKDIHGDRKTDLAIVRLQDVKGSSLPFLELGDSDAMEIGDRVLAVGAPFGLTGTVTHGIVSAKGRTELRMNMYEDFIQTDAAINPGNSGGPLVNLEGKVIGINSAIKSGTGGFQGVGLAISSNLARNVMHQLLKDGVVRRGYLGVQVRDLDPEVANRLGIKDQHGVLVSMTFEGAPAAKGGLQAGDIITTIGGKALKDSKSLRETVAALPLGKPIEVVILRDGKAKTLSITIDEQPEEFGTARAPVPQGPRGDRETINLEKFGISLSDLTPELADQFGFREKVTGAIITEVDSGSSASLAGLRRGMLIQKVDKKAVASAVEVRDTLNKASLEKGVLLQVYSPQGGTNFIVLKTES